MATMLEILNGFSLVCEERIRQRPDGITVVKNWQNKHLIQQLKHLESNRSYLINHIKFSSNSEVHK